MPVVIIRATTTKDAATLARDINNPNMDPKALMRNLTQFLGGLGGGGGQTGGPTVSITVIDEHAESDHISVAINNPQPGDELIVNGTSFKCVLPEVDQNEPNDNEFFPGPSPADNLTQAIQKALGEEIEVANSLKSIALKQKDGEGQISLEARGSGGIAVAGAGFQAFGTITLIDNPKDGDELSVAGHSFKGVSVDEPGESDFQVGGDVSATANAIANAINASNIDVHAQALGSTIAVRARKAGVEGNDISLEVSEKGPFKVSGPKLVSGSDPAQVDFNPGHFAPVTMTF